MNRRILVTVAVAAIVVLIAVTTGVVVWRTTTRAIAGVKPEERAADLSALVSQVRELSRLETASMRVLHVGKVTQTYKMVPDAIAGDEITFLAAGDVIAGIDLSRLDGNRVSRSPDGTITLYLPPPQIFVTRIDNHESKVLSRKTGALRRADVDLETRARQHAEDNVKAEAIRKGILRMASVNAEKKLAEFLHTLGFDKVRFVSGPQRLGSGGTAADR